MYSPFSPESTAAKEVQWLREIPPRKSASRQMSTAAWHEPLTTIPGPYLKPYFVYVLWSEVDPEPVEQPAATTAKREEPAVLAEVIQRALPPGPVCGSLTVPRTSVFGEGSRTRTMKGKKPSIASPRSPNARSVAPLSARVAGDARIKTARKARNQPSPSWQDLRPNSCDPVAPN